MFVLEEATLTWFDLIIAASAALTRLRSAALWRDSPPFTAATTRSRGPTDSSLLTSAGLLTGRQSDQTRGRT